MAHRTTAFTGSPTSSACRCKRWRWCSNELCPVRPVLGGDEIFLRNRYFQDTSRTCKMQNASPNACYGHFWGVYPAISLCCRSCHAGATQTPGASWTNLRSYVCHPQRWSPRSLARPDRHAHQRVRWRCRMVHMQGVCRGAAHPATGRADGHVPRTQGHSALGIGRGWGVWRGRIQLFFLSRGHDQECDADGRGAATACQGCCAAHVLRDGTGDVQGAGDPGVLCWVWDHRGEVHTEQCTHFFDIRWTKQAISVEVQ